MRKGVRGFAVRFLLGYAVVVSLWVAGMERRYDDALAWTAMHVLAAVERPPLTLRVVRDGTDLIAAHGSSVAGPDQVIDARRVHSNTALFVALTVATPNVTWAARALWLAAGGTLLSASHLAHLVATIHRVYAMQNVGPYACDEGAGELGYARWADLWDLWWKGGPCLRRGLMLRLESLFGVALQRVIPCALWLPLFLRGVSRRRTPGPSSTATQSPSVSR